MVLDTQATEIPFLISRQSHLCQLALGHLFKREQISRAKSIVAMGEYPLTSLRWLVLCRQGARSSVDRGIRCGAEASLIGGRLWRSRLSIPARFLPSQPQVNSLEM